MKCEKCKDTGVIVEVHEGRDVPFFCDSCTMGQILGRQICSDCGGWRGPTLAAQSAPLCLCRRPLAGNVVRLTGPWSIAPAGTLGVIGGLVNVYDDFLHICFRAGCFNDGKSVSCSGGPATIALPAFLLTPTEEIMNREFWRWKDVPRAGGGEYYTMDVPVWEWDGVGFIMDKHGNVVRDV